MVLKDYAEQTRRYSIVKDKSVKLEAGSDIIKSILRLSTGTIGQNMKNLFVAGGITGRKMTLRKVS